MRKADGGWAESLSAADLSWLWSVSFPSDRLRLIRRAVKRKDIPWDVAALVVRSGDAQAIGGLLSGRHLLDQPWGLTLAQGILTQCEADPSAVDRLDRALVPMCRSRSLGSHPDLVKRLFALGQHGSYGHRIRLELLASHHLDWALRRALAEGFLLEHEIEPAQVDRSLVYNDLAGDVNRYVLDKAVWTVLCARSLDPAPKRGDLVRLFREDRRCAIPWGQVLAWRETKAASPTPSMPRYQELDQGRMGTVVKVLRGWEDNQGLTNLHYHAGDPIRMDICLVLLDDGSRWAVEAGALEVVR